MSFAHLLLRGFGSRKKKRSKRQAPDRRSRTRSSSAKAQKHRLQLRFKRTRRSKVAQNVLLPENEPQVATPPSLPAVPAPTQQTPSLSKTERALSISDLIRPDGALKSSIEGFLLDQRSEHTRRAYGKDLKRFVEFLHFRSLGFGPERLTRTIVIAYKESLLSEGLQHTTVDRHLATLKSFFHWLKTDGLIVENPAENVRFLKPKRLSTTQGFSDEEVRRVLARPDLHTRTGAMHYAILMVLFYCGLRRSELCELRTSHLGMEHGHKVLRVRGKGNSERIIVMIPAVWSAIAHYLNIRQQTLSEDRPLFSPIRNNRTGVNDKPLDSSMIFYIVKRYSQEAGVLNRVSPHSCRATAISNARDHHVPDRAIQEFAGWASPDMITRYDKRKTSVEKSAAKAISYGIETHQNSDTEQSEDLES